MREQPNKCQLLFFKLLSEWKENNEWKKNSKWENLLNQSIFCIFITFILPSTVPQFIQVLLLVTLLNIPVVCSPTALKTLEENTLTVFAVLILPSTWASQGASKETNFQITEFCCTPCQHSGYGMMNITNADHPLNWTPGGTYRAEQRRLLCSNQNYRNGFSAPAPNSSLLPMQSPAGSTWWLNSLGFSPPPKEICTCNLFLDLTLGIFREWLNRQELCYL